MIFLITGGTGLVGKKLTEILLSEGHEVRVLTRSNREDDAVRYFTWDLEQGEIEEGALQNVDCLIHLAGAGIADKRWTTRRKEIILDSRVEPVRLLLKEFMKQGTYPGKIVSASAIGYYGFDTGERLLDEEVKPGSDYISDVVVKWEKAVDTFAKTAQIPAVKLRIGIVLDKNGGALPQLALPVKLGIGSPIGNGKQWMSWIHVDDLAQMFYQVSVNDQYEGAYNAVAPNPEQNKAIVKVLGKVLNRPIWAPKVPKFAMKLLLQERAQLVLGGNKVSSTKIENEGFDFKFSEIKAALEEIYR
ncbi:TIGR01777 family oxidoreductase [Jiulongibacter sp. NS-SX5]|uniref:TIGR01777 family oxidoreductase n=1 Tax=Jiulongibacter sp. NS-SX5 TaxID=3463854 RepID=UPI0040587FD0